MNTSVHGEDDESAFFARYESTQAKKVQEIKASLAFDDNEDEEDKTPAAVRCRRCQSSKIRYIIVQNRSRDEAGSTILTCKKCGNKWYWR